MANRISVILDLATDKAIGGVKGFKASINDADGAVNKFKAGSKAAFESIKQHASQMALAAGAALVAFGAKGVAAFTDLALEAGKFRDVTGATLDEASRWIAVGDDIGVSGDAISGAFNKMNIAIGAGKPLLAEYGIELKHTADGQADANATFLNAIDTINGIQDPTKRAELAAATFGKGWTSMSELIEQGSGQITAAMAEVSDAQIIDESEIAKAKKYRESMDKLGDSVKDLAMEVGEELTPAVSIAADTLATLAPIAGDVAGFVSDQFVKMVDGAYDIGQAMADMVDALPFVEIVGLQEGIEHTTYEFEKLERSVTDNIDAWQQGVGSMDEFIAKLEAMGLSQDEINLAVAASKFSLDKSKASTDALAGSTEDLTAATDEATESTGYGTLAQEEHAEATDNWKMAEASAADQVDETREAIEAQTDAVNAQIDAKVGLVGGDIAVRNAQRDAAAAVAELTVAMEEGELSSEELAAQTDATALELIGAAEAAAGYDEKLANANGKVLTAAEKNDLLRDKLQQVADTLAPGSPLRLQLDGYISDLDRIPSEIGTRVFITGSGAAGSHQGPVRGSFAEGGTVPGPVGAPQLIVAHGGEEFLGVNGSNGNGHSNGYAAFNLTVNAGLGANGQEIGDIIVGKIKEYERRNGPNWRRT